jgi:hypothetical protein
VRDSFEGDDNGEEANPMSSSASLSSTLSSVSIEKQCSNTFSHFLLSTP